MGDSRKDSAGVVRRSELIGRVLNNGPFFYTVLIAPPFSGKTVFASQVAQEARDAGMNVCEARSMPGLLKGIENTCDQISAHIPDLIVVDEIENYSSEHLAGLFSKVQESGGQIRILLLGRKQGHLPLARLGLTGTLLELDGNDIAFNSHEACHFLQLSPDDANSRDFRHVMRVTQGWIAGLAHVKHFLGRGADFSRAKNILDGDSGAMADFFEQEILPDLTEDQIHFLMKASLLKEITQQRLNDNFEPDNTLQLRTLSRDCTLLQEQNDNPGVYLLHPLFKDYLCYRFRSEAPQDWRETLQQIAHSNIQNKDFISAAEHLLDLGEFDQATSILTLYAESAFTTEVSARQFFSLARRIPDKFFSHLDQALLLARAAAVAGRFGYAHKLLQEAQNSADDGAHRRNLADTVRILIALGEGRYNEVCSEGWALLARMSAPIDRAMLAAAISLASIELLDTQMTGRAVELALTESRRAEAAYSQAWSTILSAINLRDQVRLTEATSQLESLVDSKDAGGAVRMTCEIVLSSIKRLQGDAHRAKELLDRSYDIGSRHGVWLTAILAIEVRARLLIQQGDTKDAMNFLWASEGWLCHGFGDQARMRLKILQAEVLLRMDQGVHGHEFQTIWSEIQEWPRSQTASSLSPALNERIQLLRTRSALAMGQSKEALSAVGPVLSVATNSGRVLARMEAKILYIAALALGNAKEKAVTNALELLELSLSTKCTQMVLDDLPLLRPLAPDLLKYLNSLQSRLSGDMQALLRLIIESAGLTIDSATLESEPGVLDASLTKKEVKLLRLVSRGYSNSEIATADGISLQTVKWHMHNVFAKLNAKNRVEAVKIAKDLALI